MVLSECPVPVEQLLKVVVEVPCMRLGNDTSVGSELSIVRVVDLSSSGFVKTSSCIECELEVPQERDIDKSSPGKRIPLIVDLVEHRCLERIRIVEARADRPVFSHSVVIHVPAVAVLHYIAVLILDIQRIDRGDPCRGGKYIVGAVGYAFVGIGRIVVVIGIRHIGPHFQPALGLIIRFQTGRVTVHVRTIDDSLIVEVSERRIETCPFR